MSGKTAGFRVVGFRGAGLFVLAVAAKTPVSAVCIARSRFIRQDGFVRVCRNGYVRGFSGAALLVARVQIPAQFPDGLVALIRGESAGFHNDHLQFLTAIHRRREVLSGEAAVRRFLPLGGSGDSRREGEKRQSSPVHHPVKHHAQRVNVRLRAVVPAVGNLGSHVAHSAGHSSGGGLLGHFSNAKVAKFELPTVGDQNILRFDVPVDDMMLLTGEQRIAEAKTQLQNGHFLIIGA